MLRPVYHGENGLRTLRELARTYQTISKDLTRVMNRVKALYRGWVFPVPGPMSMLPAIGRNGCRRSSTQVCVDELSCSMNSWMDYRLCDARCDPSYWRRVGNIRL